MCPQQSAPFVSASRGGGGWGSNKGRWWSPERHTEDEGLFRLFYYHRIYIYMMKRVIFQRFYSGIAGMYMCEVTTISFWSLAALGDMRVIGGLGLPFVVLFVF